MMLWQKQLGRRSLPRVLQNWPLQQRKVNGERNRMERGNHKCTAELTKLSIKSLRLTPWAGLASTGAFTGDSHCLGAAQDAYGRGSQAVSHCTLTALKAHSSWRGIQGNKESEMALGIKAQWRDISISTTEYFPMNLTLPRYSLGSDLDQSQSLELNRFIQNKIRRTLPEKHHRPVLTLSNHYCVCVPLWGVLIEKYVKS